MRKFRPRSSTSSTATTRRRPTSRSSSGTTRRACTSPPCCRHKYKAMVGEPGGKDWGVNEAGMKQMDDNIGVRSQEAGGHGPTRQHHCRVHHRQRRRGDQLPGWRRHAVQGPEGRGLGRRLPRADGRALAGPHQAGNGEEPAVCCARLGADAGRYRGRAQGRRAEDSRSRPEVSRHRQDHARRRRPARLSRRQVGEIGARLLLLLLGATPSAVRYKNWKMYYTMSQPGPAGWIMPLIPFHFTWSRTSSAIRSSRRSASTRRPQ